jgi:hypothetical protein
VIETISATGKTVSSPPYFWGAVSPSSY